MVWGLGLRSRLLVATGAALLTGAYAHAPAKAADFGGDCCSDLEDRVAELEATTVPLVANLYQQQTIRRGPPRSHRHTDLQHYQGFPLGRTVEGPPPRPFSIRNCTVVASAERLQADGLFRSFCGEVFHLWNSLGDFCRTRPSRFPCGQCCHCGCRRRGGLRAKTGQSADLGDDCCADLEDRVAELEATRVRRATKRSRCRSTAN